MNEEMLEKRNKLADEIDTEEEYREELVRLISETDDRLNDLYGQIQEIEEELT